MFDSKKPKIFFIGYHKTATTSLMHLIRVSGYKVCHHHKGRNNHRHVISQTIYKNVKMGNPILQGMEDAYAYAEMSDYIYHNEDVWHDANEKFDLLYEEYPDAYYVLQNRNTEDWIKSRHNMHNHKMTKLYYMILDTDDDSVIFDHWRMQKTKHEERVRKFFSERPEAKFLEFDIDKTDIKQLIEFVSPEYKLDETHWLHLNAKNYK